MNSVCRNAVVQDVKSFTNAMAPNSQERNGCEFKAPLVLIYQGISRTITVQDRILTVQSIDLLHGLNIYSFDAQKNYARYQWPAWGVITIYQILAGLNGFATTMILDTNSRDANDVETNLSSVIQ